jgi:Flp pilus assembly protein TadG
VTVEFILILPMVVLVALASVQLIGLARARLELQGAVRDGARVAATTPDPSRAVEAVIAAMAPSQRQRLRVAVERPSLVGAPAVVTATLRHLLGPPFPSDYGVDLNARATMPVER